MTINNGSNNPYPNAPDDTAAAAPGTEPETGSGGGDMGIWSKTREAQLNSMVTQGYQNLSSYTLPTGVVDTARYGTAFENYEVGTAAPSASAEAGDGGGVMDVWYKRRVPKLDTLARGAYVNASSFGLPSGVVDVKNYGTPYDQAEKGLGFYVEGQAIAPNGLALEGTLKVIADGSELSGNVVAGSFITAFEPFEGVTQGTDSDEGIPTLDLEFEPTADGVGKELPDTSYPRSSYFDVSYGYISGLVTNRAGERLSGELVRAGTVSTFSGEDGFYYLLVPGGNGVEMTGLDGTQTKQGTAQGGDTVRIDWQYGGIQAKVTGPDGLPIENAPVTIDGDTYRTDGTGTVTVETVGLGDHDLTIMDSFEDTLTVLDEGQLAKTSFAGGAQLTVRAVDGVSGEPVVDLPAIHLQENTLSYSAPNGKVSILSVSGNEFDVLVGYQDKRYKPKELSEEVADGETNTSEVVLERKTAITNS